MTSVTRKCGTQSITRFYFYFPLLSITCKPSIKNCIYILGHSSSNTEGQRLITQPTSCWFSYNWFVILICRCLSRHQGISLTDDCLTWWTRQHWGFEVPSNQVKPRKREKKKKKVSNYWNIFIFTDNRSENQIKHDDTIITDIHISELVGFWLDLYWNPSCLWKCSVPSAQTKLGWVPTQHRLSSKHTHTLTHRRPK